MKAEFIPKVITLLAGAVVCIVAIGIIAQKIILKVEQSNRFIRSKRDEELREQEKEQQEQQDEQTQTGEQTDSDQEER